MVSGIPFIPAEHHRAIHGRASLANVHHPLNAPRYYREHGQRQFNSTYCRQPAFFDTVSIFQDVETKRVAIAANYFSLPQKFSRRCRACYKCLSYTHCSFRERLSGMTAVLQARASGSRTQKSASIPLLAKIVDAQISGSSASAHSDHRLAPRSNKTLSDFLTHQR